MGGKCFVGAREAAEGRRGHVTRVDDVTVRDNISCCSLHEYHLVISIGGVTFLTTKGTAPSLIKAHGHWSSDAFLIYI